MFTSYWMKRRINCSIVVPYAVHYYSLYIVSIFIISTLINISNIEDKNFCTLLYIPCCLSWWCSTSILCFTSKKKCAYLPKFSWSNTSVCSKLASDVNYARFRTSLYRCLWLKFCKCIIVRMLFSFRTEHPSKVTSKKTRITQVNINIIDISFFYLDISLSK